jgi:hypothetical protein
MNRALFAALAAGLTLAGGSSVIPAEAGPTLPVVEDVAWGPLRDHCRQLLQALDALGQPLPAETAKPLLALLDREPADADAAARSVQELLDRHCLLGVSINPESRVKAARGSAAALLRKDRPVLVLVKVHNDAGITHPLAVRGAGVLAGDQAPGGRWLEAAFVTEPPLGQKLSGRRLEYRVLRLRAREAGKREATFLLDAGHGTQDLGFRAEVPVLFSVRTP